MSAVDTLFAVSLWTRCRACRAAGGLCADHHATDNLSDPGEVFCRECGLSHQPLHLRDLPQERGWDDDESRHGEPR